ARPTPRAWTMVSNMSATSACRSGVSKRSTGCATRSRRGSPILRMAWIMAGRSVVAALALDELDLVAVRVLDEGDDRGAVLHGAGLARDLAAFLLDLFTGVVGVFHFQGDMAVAVAQVVAGGVPVVGQLDDGAFAFILVADEGQGELAVGVVFAAQHAHALDIGVEIDGLVQVADAQHGVQETHGEFLVLVMPV